MPVSALGSLIFGRRAQGFAEQLKILPEQRYVHRAFSVRKPARPTRKCFHDFTIRFSGCFCPHSYLCVFSGHKTPPVVFSSTTGGAFFTVRAFGGSQDVGVVAYTLRLSQICSSFFTFLALTSIIYSGRSLLVDRLHKFIDGCRRLRFD